jgi:hypothetical protein
MVAIGTVLRKTVTNHAHLSVPLEHEIPAQVDQHKGAYPEH